MSTLCVQTQSKPASVASWMMVARIALDSAAPRFPSARSADWNSESCVVARISVYLKILVIMIARYIVARTAAYPTRALTEACARFTKAFGTASPELTQCQAEMDSLAGTHIELVVDWESYAGQALSVIEQQSSAVRGRVKTTC